MSKSSLNFKFLIAGGKSLFCPLCPRPRRLFFSALTFSSFEVYFYDLEAVQDEADDPLKAVLFHWPLQLSEEHVVLVAGHLVIFSLVSFLNLWGASLTIYSEPPKSEIRKKPKSGCNVGQISDSFWHL